MGASHNLYAVAVVAARAGDIDSAAVGADRSGRRNPDAAIAEPCRTRTTAGSVQRDPPRASRRDRRAVADVDTCVVRTGRSAARADQRYVARTSGSDPGEIVHMDAEVVAPAARAMPGDENCAARCRHLRSGILDVHAIVIVRAGGAAGSIQRHVARAGGSHLRAMAQVNAAIVIAAARAESGHGDIAIDGPYRRASAVNVDAAVGVRPGTPGAVQGNRAGTGGLNDAGVRNTDTTR